MGNVTKQNQQKPLLRSLRVFLAGFAFGVAFDNFLNKNAENIHRVRKKGNQ